jgi:hypothetical protein
MSMGSTTTPPTVQRRNAPPSPRPMVKGFHPEPYHEEGSRSGASKRVTIPADIATAGAEALSFRPKKPSRRSLPSVRTRYPQGRPPTHDSGLPESKRRQHQSPPMSAPRHPHDRRYEPPPPPRRSPKRHSCGPPSGAAAPASTNSSQGSDKHHDKHSRRKGRGRLSTGLQASSRTVA